MDEFVIKKYKPLALKEGKLYFFDICAFVKAISEKKITSLSTAMELVADDCKGKKRTAERIKSVLKGNDESIGLNTVYLLGRTFADGDEMAFIKEVNVEVIPHDWIDYEKKKDNTQIKEVYELLYKVLYEVVESSYYNYVPGEENENVDAFEYYEKRIDEIRNFVNTKLLDKIEVRQKLLQIIDETERYIKSYSIPGVVKRWKDINKKITYFDAVYDICAENYDLYKAVCDRKVGFDNSIVFCFAFLPTKKDFEDQAQYFYEINKNIKDGNLQYSYEKVFRNELLITLEKVFNHDFPDLFTKEYIVK